jgi:galactokinase
VGPDDSEHWRGGGESGFLVYVTPQAYRAPGRVNLIGEHTDYNLGFVLPIAIDLACVTRRLPVSGGGNRLELASHNLNEERAFEIATLADEKPTRSWTDYPIGVAQQLLRLGVPVEPARLEIASTVPVGSGLSSSASLEVSTALAMLDGRGIERAELVRLCHRAENEFVGLPCGIMDQFISVFGEAHAAVKIDCRTQGYETVQLPEGAAIVAVNTMVKHELGGSAYRERVRECREAVAAIGTRKAQVGSLRDVSSDEVQAFVETIAPVPYRRALHITSENERVLAFIEAARVGNLARMGELFVASHRSLQHDYEVSCEELDFMVDTALTLDGVYGARMTGGGFGGCTVNLVRPDAVADFKRGIREAYRARFGLEAEIYEFVPSGGAGPV